MHKHSSLAPLAMLAMLCSCGAPADQDYEEGAEISGTSAELEDDPAAEGGHLPPQGVGEALAADRNKSLARTLVPDIYLDPATREEYRDDMQALIDASLAALAAPEFRFAAAAVDSDYPAAYLSSRLPATGTRDIAAMMQSAPQGYEFARTRLFLSRGGGVVTGVRNKQVYIQIPRYVFNRWRSQSPVQRSCAINSVAHEISHTLVPVGTSRYLPAFADTGAGNRGQTSYASYLSGNMAQCGHLQANGRITANQVAACIPVWNVRPKFSAFKCDDFDDGGPIE